MPVHSVCQIINESDNKIWRLLERYVDKALEFEDYSHITAIGMDETSRTKGHNYITLFVDMLKGKTVHVAEGKDYKTVVDFVVFYNLKLTHLYNLKLTHLIKKIKLKIDHPEVII